jgi:hypothetical protein
MRMLCSIRRSENDQPATKILTFKTTIHTEVDIFYVFHICSFESAEEDLVIRQNRDEPTMIARTEIVKVSDDVQESALRGHPSLAAVPVLIFAVLLLPQSRMLRKYVWVVTGVAQLASDPPKNVLRVLTLR